MINETGKSTTKGISQENIHIVEDVPGWKTVVIEDQEKFQKEAREFMTKRLEETKVEGKRSMERFIYLISRDIDKFNNKKRSFVGFGK